jgi:hypothetical protein
MVKLKLNIRAETERLKIDDAARWLAWHGDKPAAPELTEAQLQEAHRLPTFALVSLG